MRNPCFDSKEKSFLSLYFIYDLTTRSLTGAHAEFNEVFEMTGLGIMTKEEKFVICVNKKLYVD